MLADHNPETANPYITTIHTIPRVGWASPEIPSDNRQNLDIILELGSKPQEPFVPGPSVAQAEQGTVGAG